jgi:hypothetical protein
MELADRYYEDSLERSLLAASFTPEEEEGRRPRYHHHLLGTIGPTRVDALLFAHLAEARNDVHLPRVLSCRPLLKQIYFEGMCDAYFGDGYADGWRMRNPKVGPRMDTQERRRQLAQFIQRRNSGEAWPPLNHPV